MISIISIVLSVTAIVLNIINIKRLKSLDRFDYLEGFNPKKYFKGRCPYTNKRCKHFRCEDCPVEAEERKYMQENGNA